MKFCTPMKRHYMTRIAGDAAIALSMAKEMQSKAGEQPGVAELVETIGVASRRLIALCESHPDRLSQESHD